MARQGPGGLTGQFEVYKKPDADSLVYVSPGASSKDAASPVSGSATASAPVAGYGFLLFWLCSAASISLSISIQRAGKKSDGKSSKGKYVTLDAQMLKEGLLPGRHPCKCLGEWQIYISLNRDERKKKKKKTHSPTFTPASRHKLLTNCLRCGRIICEQEGPGPCMTCGNEVFDKKQQSRIAQRLHEQLVAEGKDQISAGEVKKALEREEQQRKAEEYKNKLLEFDRSSARRTKVIDDETDYYSSETNSWLSNKEKETLRQKEEAIRVAREERERQRLVTIDLAGRRVVESAFDEGEDKESRLRRMYEEDIENTRADVVTGAGTGYYANITNSVLEMNPRFVRVKGDKQPSEGEQQHHHQHQGAGAMSRIQHDFDSGNVDLAEGSLGSAAGASTREGDDSDQGLCLSMWQPWASLLVCGIKVVEGRSWSTAHRGRLWIAAAAKKAAPEEMRTVIDQHVAQGPAGKPLPKIFPTSCVLGCVDIVDCLTLEQYQANVPDPLQRQSESAFVFVCANHKTLKTPVPISGDHKIFSLEPEVLERCQSQLRQQHQETAKTR